MSHLIITTHELLAEWITATVFKTLLAIHPPIIYYSDTTLELLPDGTYNITERLVTLMQKTLYSGVHHASNVSTTCQPGVTFGVATINVEISNLEIRHCSAELWLKESDGTILTCYNAQISQSLGYKPLRCKC